MKDVFEFNALVSKMWWEAMDVHRNAATTIAMRMPHLMNGGVDMFGRPTAEAKLMVAEKMDAMKEGAQNAAAAGMDLAHRMTQQPMSPATLATNILNVADAGMAPAKNKVQANATRLTKRAPTGRHK